MARVGTQSACTDTILTMPIPMESFSAAKNRHFRSRPLLTFINASSKHCGLEDATTYEARADLRPAFHERNSTRRCGRTHSYAAAWIRPPAFPLESCVRPGDCQSHAARCT